MKHLTPYMTDDGERYGVAKDQEEEFKADFGEHAQPVHAYRTSDGTTYTVSDAEAAEFARDFPDAEPVRRLSFANGKERDFTARELRTFMSGRGEFQTSDEFKADRDERDAKVRKRLAEGYAASTKGDETPVPVAADVPTLPFSEESADTLVESAKGVAYMARKTVAPYVSAFLTGAMRLMGRAMHSGVGMTPSLAGGTSVRFAPPKESGDIWVAAAKEIDAAVAPSAEDEKRAKESGLAIPGKVEEVAQGIGAFALAMHNLGPAVGMTLMSAEAGNDAYISLYDAGIAKGLDPKDADNYANAGGAIATLGTAAMCRLPVSRLLGKFGLTKAPVADIERGMVGKTAVNNYSELVDAVTVGNMKKFLVDTAVVAGESGLIMGAQTYGVALAGAAEQGLDVGSGEVQRAAAWEGIKAGAEGAGIGALLGGMNYAAYKRAVRAGVAAEAQSAMYSPEGRAAWREFFPEGTTAMALKRALGKDISRADANKAGLPEMTARERNAIADLFVKDRMDAAKAAERQRPLGNGEPPAAPEPQKPQPKPPPPEPVPQTKEERAQSLREQIADASEECKTLAKASAERGYDSSGKKFGAAYARYLQLQRDLNKLDGTPIVDEFAPPQAKATSDTKPEEPPSTKLDSNHIVFSEGVVDTLPGEATDPVSGKSYSPQAGFARALSDIETQLTKYGGDGQARYEEMNRILASKTYEALLSRLSEYAFSFRSAMAIKSEWLRRHPEELKRRLEMAVADAQIEVDEASTPGRREGKEAALQEAQNRLDAFNRAQDVRAQAKEAADPPSATETPVSTKPAPKAVQKSSGDVAKDLAEISEGDLDALINDALAEKENGEAAATTPPTKIVNKGKGPVEVSVAPTETDAATEQPQAKPRMVNKGKGLVPVVPQTAPDAATAKAEARRVKERAKVSEGLSGDAAAAMGDLYDLFGASESVKGSLGMAARPVEGFDEELYNSRVRKGFDAILADCQSRGGGVKDFVQMVVGRLGGAARPYIHRFAADLKGAANGRPEGAEGGRDGFDRGRDEDAGRGDGAAGALPAEPAGGQRGAQPGNQGAEHSLPAGVPDGQGGGGRDGVRPNGGVAGHGPDLGGMRPSSDPVGNRLAAEDARTGSHAGQPSVVRAANGNIDTRASAPVRLSKARRLKVNEEVKELVEKPVGSLTDAELDTLRQFTGAGGLGFKGKDAATQIAALNQHFTDYPLVDAVWNALEKAKVPMKKALEPSAGSGNFPGRRPELDWTLCELEPTAAKVLKHLFPGAKVMPGTFEDVKLADAQDVVISNFPFLEQRHHPNRPDIKTLHDFFFVHSAKQLKPNGVVAAITSTGTMDKLDPAVRRELMETCDVIGAFRLPQGTFASAGTDTAADVIFLQKRPDGVPPRPENKALNDAFVGTAEWPGSDGRVRVNGYFAERPEAILGDASVEQDMRYGGRETLAVRQSDATDLSQMAINYKPYPVAESHETNKGGGSSGGKPKANADEGAKPSYPHTVEGLDKAGVKYELSDGNGTYSQNIRMYDGVPHVKADEFTLDGYEEGTHMAKVFVPVGGENAKKIAALQHIVDDAAAFQAGDADAAKRGEAEIADYKERFGVHPTKDKALRKFFKDNGEEIYFRELAATFDEDFKPAESFRNKVKFEGSGRKHADENSSLIDQALASEDGSGEIRLGGERCKVAESDVGDLLQSGYSISGVDGGGKPILQNNVVFESGNLYKKIDAQKKMKESLPSYAAQIDAQVSRLESLLPVKKVFDAIPFKGNDGWTSQNEEGWVAPVLRKAGIYIYRSVNEKSGMAEFSVSTPYQGGLTPDECEILGNYMSGKSLLKKKDDEADMAYLAREREAEGRLTDIYAKIRARVAEDPERVAEIERGYNERFNGYVKPDYAKAQYLIADTVKAFEAAGIRLRDNQKRWVTQALIEGVGINAHDVGGGKTLAAMALAHALKARGVCKKPMFVVPAKTIKTSWLNSANGMQKLFPNAKIVNLGSLPADKRTKALFDLANSTADAVFISHEGFEAIQLTPKDEEAALRRYADGLVDGSEDRKEAKQRESLEAYLEAVSKEKRDTRLTFDKLGVDCLIVDEAHNFKNVGVSSRLGTAGLGKAFGTKRDKKTGRYTIDSHRAHDFRFKADFVAERNNGRNVFLLTATPTPNKPIELYTMLRHLGRRVLGDYGIYTDRDFAAKFFALGKRECQATTGGTKPKTILTDLLDVYALKDIMTRYIDRIPMEAFAAQGIKLPEVVRETKFVDMSSDMEMVQDEINARVAAAAGSFTHEEGEDTVIGAFMNGRDAGVTPYVYGGRHARVRVEDRSHDPATDKIEYAIQETVHELNLGKKEGKPRTVIIFSDVQGGRDGRPSVPADIKQSLIARGMDPKEIAVVTGSVCTNPKTGQEVQAAGKKAQELKGEIQDLFAPKGEKPAAPKIKVIIGSTASIGEGLNLNTWTTLSINLDVPMTPGAFKQREGRSVRFGNQHEKVRVVNLVTRGSYDTLSLSLVARKKGWNQAIWDADVKDTINIEDEMSSSAGIDPNEIIIESLRDPVEKIRRRVDYDLGKMANAVEQARAQVYSVDGRIATQKRNAQAAQARIDERVTSVYKLKNEAQALTDGVPALEEKAKRAFGDLAEYAAGTGEQAKADALKGLVQSVKDARAELAKEQAAQKNADEGYEKLDAAKKSLGAAKDALADGIKAFADKDGQAFARIYANAEGAISSAQEKAASLLSSVPYHEGVIANAKRDIEAAEARVKELEAERDKAEALYKQTLDERNALGSEWYENFGTPEQQFLLEKATVKADMDAKNRAEDEAEEWMGVRQTIEAMPAPKSTGKKPLANGKLPGHGDFGPSGTTNTGKTVNRSQVFAFARELFPELHITNKGTYRRPGVLGWLEVENRVIRTLDPLSIPTLAHELGHGVVRLAGENFRSMSRAARREFIALGTDLYGAKAPTGGYTSEGVAEFVRGFLCDYDLAKDFPEAHKWFFEDFGERNPEFVERLFALKGKILEYSGMTPEQKIRGMWDHKLPVSPSEIPWWRRCMRQDWKKNWVDSNWPLMRAVRECGADFNFHNPKYTPAERADMILNHPYMLATFFQGKAMRFAETDALTCTTDIYGAETGVSLMGILMPIARNGKESLKEFWDFAVAMRGADYARKGLEFGASRGEIAATIARHRSKEGFRDALKAITDWSHRVLHLLVDAGAITPEEYQKICDANPVYVPIHRIFAEADIDRLRKLSGKPGVFARKGGSQDIDAPATALVEMAARIRQAAMQAKIVNALVDMHDRARAEGSKTLNRFMVEMPNPVKRTVVDANSIKDQIAKMAAARFGADADKLASAMKDTWEDKLFVFTTKPYAGSQPNIVSIHDKTGRLRTFEVMDPGIVSVLKGYSEPERLTGLGKAGMAIANMMRMGATVLKPAFALGTNPIRDAITAFVMGEYGESVPGIATLEGMVNVALRTDLYKAFIRLGGDMGMFFQDHLHASAKDIAKVAQEANPFVRQMRKGLVTMVGDILSIPEVGTRLKYFRMAKNYWEAQGVGTTAAELVARLVGGDVTIDFGRAGDISRKINRQILFFNASVRAFDQLARAGGAARQLPWQDPGKIDWGKVNAAGDVNERERVFNKQARVNHLKRLLRRGSWWTYLGLLGYFYGLLNHDNHRKWKELKPSKKWNNITVGNASFPVPYELGHIFVSFPVALAESIEDGSPKPLKELAIEMARSDSPIELGDWHALLRNFSYLSIPVDIIANKRWDGAPIVPTRMMRMDSRDWQNQNTTWYAKAIGNMAAEMFPEGMKDARQMFAPIRVDYVVDSLLGGLPREISRTFEAVTSKRGAIGVDGDWTRIPVYGRLSLSPFSASRLPGDFYDELDALQAKHQSARLDAAGLGRLRAMEDVQKKYLGEFSAARRRILTEDMDERERQTLINKCSKLIIDTIRTFNETANTADFRARGVEAAAAALSKRSVAESTAPSYRRVVSEVGYEAAANALRRYGARKAWSKKTLDGRLRNLYNNAQ